MKLTVIQENDDGSVDVQLDNIEPEMLQLLLQEGLTSLLTKELERLQREQRIPALFKNAPKVEEEAV